MKLRMAENSLFAILLRSHWSISLLIALAFAVVSRAALPEQYWLLGAMGGTPFWVIAGMAAWRQRHRLPPARVGDILGAAAAMGWREFAQAVDDGFSRDGWQVQRTDSTREGDAGLIIRRGAITAVVAARRWKAARVGEEQLRQLLASRDAHGASQCVLLTLGEVPGNADAFARSHGVQVMQGEALAQLLRQLGTPKPVRHPAR